MEGLNCKQILSENIDGLIEFMQILIIHNGNYKPERLWKVEKTNDSSSIRMGFRDEKINDYCILMGGEVSNSFVPLYEVGYFFQALFLSAVGSCVLKKGWLGKYKQIKNPDILTQNIKSDLESLDNQTILNNLKSPIIAIVSALDTDVTPTRYNKHQLWRLDPSVLSKYGGQIDCKNYAQSEIDETFKDEYWVDEDRLTAEKMMEFGQNLPQTKAMLIYNVFEKICHLLSMEISDISLFFLFSPQEELINAGSNFSFLDVLSAVNTPDKKHIYRLLTKQDNPWAISTSCPSCGQASKTIIYTKIMDDTRTIRISCKEREYKFENERGDFVTDKGCGEVNFIDIPRGTKKLHEFIKSHNITIHFPTRSTMFILKDSAVTPICLVAGDLGLGVGKHGQVKPRQNVPVGYGDHLDMLISSILFQDCILDTETYDTILARYLTLKDVYLSHTQTIFCYDRPTKLVDAEVYNYKFPETRVSDTSIFKYLSKGGSIFDLFYDSIRLYPFGLKDAKRLRDVKNHLILKHSNLTY